MFGDQYQVNENYISINFIKGEWECVIQKAEIKTSKNGKYEMAVLEFLIEEQGALKYYLIDNRDSQEMWELTNKRFTRFFDCFNIQRGNFNVQSWVGKKGIIKIDKGKPNEKGEQFFEVKTFIVSTINTPQQQMNNGYQQRQNQMPPQNRPSAYQPAPQPTPQNNYQQQQVSNDNGLDFDTVPF